MEIKSRISASIQQNVTSENAEVKGDTASKVSKLLSDSEISTARGSRDMFQVVDSEASSEFLIGQASKLSKGDVQNDINRMESHLDELKNQKTEDNSDKENKWYTRLVSWFTRRIDD